MSQDERDLAVSINEVKMATSMVYSVNANLRNEVSSLNNISTKLSNSAMQIDDGAYKLGQATLMLESFLKQRDQLKDDIHEAVEMLRTFQAIAKPPFGDESDDTWMVFVTKTEFDKLNALAEKFYKAGY